MKRIGVCILVSLPILTIAVFALAKQLPEYEDADFFEKVLTVDPTQLTPEQFYGLEFGILAGHSGSGGYFLGEEEIAWLRNAENCFKKRGTALKDEYDRDQVIAWSYFNAGKYQKALKEFMKDKDQYGIELAEWHIHNGKGQKENIAVREYPGSIPCENSEITRAQNDRYLFISYFRGPIYRYDKETNRHAIIFSPEWDYDWCDQLSFDGRFLMIRLRDDAGGMRFDNEDEVIASLQKS